MLNNIKILEFGYVVSDIKTIIENHKKQDEFNNIIYFDVVDNINVCILIFNNKIDNINVYVIGINHNHIFNNFSIENILEIINYITVECNDFIFIKNTFNKLIRLINNVEVLNKILDVEIYQHYYNNTINTNTSIFNILETEKRIKEINYNVKINYSIINIYNIIQCSSLYYDNFIDLCFSDNKFNDNDKINSYIVNFNFLNKLISNGLNFEGKLNIFNYVINSVTKRPTIGNSFNYMNLSKKDGSREKITSKYKDGYLVEVDFQSYHLQLLDLHLGLFTNKLVDFNYHNEMSKIYFGKEIETEEDKNNVKKNTFYLLYNNNYNKEDSEVINKITNFKIKLIEYYSKNSKIKSISGGYIYINEEDDNRLINKIINYFMQDLETNTNLDMIKKMYLDNLSKYDLILYVYDSFLFDIKKEEIKEFIEYIKHKFNNYIYTLKIGTNYDNLKQITGTGLDGK